MVSQSNGYPPDLLAIDDKMVALGRPLPPAVNFTQAIGAGKPPKHAYARWAAATVQWRKDLAAWEAAHPDDAAEWHILRAEYVELEERHERAKWSDSTDAYLYERLARAGAPRECVDAIRKPNDTVALQCARDWYMGGQWCLVLVGGFGVGKTSAAAWVAHQFMMRMNLGVRWVRAVAASRGSTFGVEAAVAAEQARVAGVLVLDDIGADHDNAGWRSWLEDVLDARWGNNKRTVITVNNLTLEEFKVRMGARLYDRLRTGRVYDCGIGSLRGQPPQPQREPGE